MGAWQEAVSFDAKIAPEEVNARDSFLLPPEVNSLRTPSAPIATLFELTPLSISTVSFHHTKHPGHLLAASMRRLPAKATTVLCDPCTAKQNPKLGPPLGFKKRFARIPRYASTIRICMQTPNLRGLENG
jgi:hypothetical protein